MATRKAARQRAATPALRESTALRESKLRLFGVALVCAYVALVPLVFDHSADWPFTVPKALLSHSLAYALVGVMAGLIIRFGREAFVWSWLHVPILSFLVANVAATVFAEDRLLALYGTHARMLGLATIAAWTVLYFAVVTVIRERRDVAAVVVAALGAAVLMLGYELVQALGRDPFRWNTDPTARPFSTNGQATSLAAYLTVLAVSTFAVVVAIKDVPRWTRATLLALGLALLVGASATGTRSALIGLGTGSAVLVTLVWLKHPSRRARTIGVATAAAATLGLTALLAFTPIGARLLQVSPVVGNSEEDNLARLDLASLDVRAVLYQIAVNVVSERPLLGYGPDNFVVGMTRYRPERGPEEARLSYATSAHSWVGQIAVGSGLVGLAAFVSVIGGIALMAARSPFGPIPVDAATGIAAQLGTGLTSVTDVGSDWVLWVATALLAGSAVRLRHEASASSPGTSTPRRSNRRTFGTTPAGVAVIALCLAAGLGLAGSSVRAMEASRAAQSSQDSRLLGRVGPAVDAALAATGADPGRAEYWQRLGLAYVSGARWRDAAAALERAIKIAPWDVRYLQDLVATELALASTGDSAARARADELADEAVRRDPNWPDAQFSRAVVKQFNGNFVEGTRSIERAFALMPNSTNVHWYVVATQLYVAAGRAADGVLFAQRALRTFEASEVRMELARALFANGQAGEALMQVDRVLAAQPDNTNAQRLRAEILAAIPR